MDWLWRDLRYALRGLRTQPWFTALAVLTLALGIGAATVIFSVIYNVLFDPFPYIEADRVVAIQIRAAERADQPGRAVFQLPEHLDYQAESTVFEEAIANGYEQILCRIGDGMEQLNGALVSSNTFSFLGVPPAAGRLLTPDDVKPGAPPVFVMGYKMWRKYFNLDPGIIGQTFVLNDTPTTLVGIMPRRFTKLNADLYKVVSLDRADPYVNQRFFMFQAKLKRGISREQAEAEISLIAPRLAKVYPRNYPEKFVVKIVSWVDNVVGPFRATLYSLGAAVALLLLIACSNVANMLLARAATRGKEMAIRAALGSGRARLVRQLLIESLALGLAGAVVGCAFAYFGLNALVARIPEGEIPREAVIRLNVPVLLFSLGLAVATSVLVGLVPALQATRRDLAGSLKDAHKGAGSGFRGGWLRPGLVILEVAVSLVLLASAGLMIRSFVKMVSVELGFDADRIVFVATPLPRGQYQSPEQKRQFFRQMIARIGALPEVEAVTVATSIPPYGGMGSDIDIPGKTHTERWNAIIQSCSEGQFATYGQRLLRGRLLTEVDVADARKVVVVNQTLVRQYLGEDDPIGQRVKLARLESLPPEARVEDPVFEIVGVVADIRNNGLDQPNTPEVYMPYTVPGNIDGGVVVRARGETLALLNTVRREIRAQDSNVAVTFADSLGNVLRQEFHASPKFKLIVLGVFAGVGLVLVAIGVYSVIAYTVSRQTHEIGIRMALGANRRHVLAMVMRSGGIQIGVGVIVGLAASLILTRLLRSELWHVPPHDPLTLTVVVLVLATVGLAACIFPAQRATRVNPIVALRSE